jgi:hypothetical protein
MEGSIRVQNLQNVQPMENEGVQKITKQDSGLSLKGFDFSSFTQCIAWGADLLAFWTSDK